jgi:flagellar hook-length control protein FliK
MLFFNSLVARRLQTKSRHRFAKARSPVSSVASEARPVLPPRPHSPSVRSHPEPDAREPATPFAELLDGAAPAAEPPPVHRQARSERPERADRAEQPKSKDDRRTDSKPVNDSADAKDGKAAASADDAKSAKDTKDGETVDTSAKAKDGDAAASTHAGDKPKPDADALPALLDATTPAVTAPQTATVVAVVQPPVLVTADAGAPEADALAALQAAGGASPNASTPKPVQAQGDKPADATAKASAAADPQAAASAEPRASVPQIDSGKDGQARGNGDKAAGEFHRAVADLLTKPEAAAPAPGGDAGAAAKASADAVQNLGGVSPAHTANAASAAANAPPPLQAQVQAAAVPLSGLAVEITTQAHAGNKHFEIRLDPPELGRIDVKLDVDRDGNVSTRLVVDRADTLDLLKRDASTLERALQQSGLRTSDNALEFSLRQQGFAQDDTAARNAAQLIVPDDDPAPLEAMRQGYGRLLGLGGGLDIRV